MRPARPAKPARTRHAGAGRRRGGILAAAGSEDGQFLAQPFGPALWAGGAPPMAGADQDLRVRPAFPAVKLINRHVKNVASLRPFSQCKTFLPQRKTPRFIFALPFPVLNLNLNPNLNLFLTIGLRLRLGVGVGVGLITQKYEPRLPAHWRGNALHRGPNLSL
jgi:hypothetical protein